VTSSRATILGEQPLYAEMFGDNFARCAGITVTAASPVLELCRRLVAAGHDPAQSLEAWRGSTLALRIRSIGAAARLTVTTGSNGAPVFVAAAPPMRSPDAPATPIAPEPVQRASEAAP
jgi:hypothetical protein